MTLTEQLQKIESIVNEVLKEEPQFFLVSLRIKPTNNVRLYLDGDAGLPIEKCVYFNRKIYKLLEEAHLFPEGEFSLEVSSPGVDEPLKSHRQYTKNIGRTVEVVFRDEIKKTGKLLHVAEADFILEETVGKGKKSGNAANHCSVRKYKNNNRSNTILKSGKGLSYSTSYIINRT